MKGLLVSGFLGKRLVRKKLFRKQIPALFSQNAVWLQGFGFYKVWKHALALLLC